MLDLQDPLKNGKIWPFAHSDWLSIQWSSLLELGEGESERQRHTAFTQMPCTSASLCAGFSTEHLVNYMAQLCKGEGPLGMPQHTHTDKVPHEGEAEQGQCGWPRAVGRAYLQQTNAPRL